MRLEMSRALLWPGCDPFVRLARGSAAAAPNCVTYGEGREPTTTTTTTTPAPGSLITGLIEISSSSSSSSAAVEERRLFCSLPSYPSRGCIISPFVFVEMGRAQHVMRVCALPLSLSTS